MPDTTPRHEGRAPTQAERYELERRALVAYHQARKDAAAMAQERAGAPVQARHATKTTKASTGPHNAPLHPLHFVVIHAGADVLAVYRVRPVRDYFMLRRLTRWPKDLVRLKA